MSETQSDGSREPKVEAIGPKGIGGWLVLPLIGFIGTIIMTLNNLSQIGGAELNTILTSDDPMIAALRLPTMASLIGGIVVVGIALACVILLSRHSRRLPAMAIAFYISLFVASFIEFIGDIRISEILSDSRDSEVRKELVRSGFIAAIWIPYFLKSKRVRNTFTRW